MKLAYKLLYVINTLFTLYLFANNLLFYTTTPDKIFIFALISLVLIALTVYYFIKEINVSKFDYIFSSIFILFIISTMIIIMSIQNSFSYANTICYFDSMLIIPCIIFSIYGLSNK